MSNQIIKLQTIKGKPQYLYYENPFDIIQAEKWFHRKLAGGLNKYKNGLS